MNISNLDWGIIIAFFALTLFIGIWVSKKSGANAREFFLSGNNMPWWLLGISMVATTFSADTPNLVTDIIRKNGVSGNWVWWAFLLTGMLTVFVYAKLWRRSGIMTDLEFYELRYSGKAAAFLRGFRSIYLGVFFNIMIMATVLLAGIKIGGVLLGLSSIETVVLVSVVTVLYSSLGGLRGVILTDFFQFILAMIGMIAAAIYLMNIPELGGMESVLSHVNVKDKLNFLPDFSDMNVAIPLLIIPIAVQWWSTWYPGAEPGGGGYIAQRMLSAKDESGAVKATLLFNITHYALRPWPWILIALASLILFPKNYNFDNSQTINVADAAVDSLQQIDQDDISFLISGIDNKITDNAEPEYTELKSIITQNADRLDIKSLAYIFSKKNAENANQAEWSDPLEDSELVALHLTNPHISVDKLGHDLAFSAMLSYLPKGLLGLILAGLIAALMSTISTHLNWGSSYVVNDFYGRFINKNASDRSLVAVGRISTITLMILAAIFALFLTNALQAFNILLQIGAGTGLLFILRWFWWRINAYSEIVAMVVSFVLAVYFETIYEGGLETYERMLIGVGITTVAWIGATYLTPATDHSVLTSFFKLIRPHDMGWKPVVNSLSAEETETIQSDESRSLGQEIWMMFLGCVLVYLSLFGMGSLLYGNLMLGIGQLVIAVASGYFLFNSWNKTKS